MFVYILPDHHRLLCDSYDSSIWSNEDNFRRTLHEDTLSLLSSIDHTMKTILFKPPISSPRAFSYFDPKLKPIGSFINHGPAYDKGFKIHIDERNNITVIVFNALELTSPNGRMFFLKTLLMTVEPLTHDKQMQCLSDRIKSNLISDAFRYETEI